MNEKKRMPARLRDRPGYKEPEVEVPDLPKLIYSIPGGGDPGPIGPARGDQEIVLVREPFRAVERKHMPIASVESLRSGSGTFHPQARWPWQDTRVSMAKSAR